MTKQMENILGSFTDQLVTINFVQVAVSVLILAFYAWTRFNTWPEIRQEKNGPSPLPHPPNPPRHYTTFFQYSWYAFWYMMAIQIMYLIILITPGLFEVLSDHAHFDHQINGKNMPLWALIFLTIILPITPGLSAIERIFREKLHGLALIPAGARSYIQDFKINPSRFIVDPETVEELVVDVQREVLSTDDLIRPDRRLKHRWFKLRYLCKKISDWKTNPQINSFACHCGAELNICEQRMKELRREITAYYRRRGEAQADGQITSAEKECLDRMRKDLEKNIAAMLDKAYQFICCGTLATVKTASGRLSTFKFFGFQPNLKGVPPILVDIIIICVTAVSLITFLVTYVYKASSNPTPEALKTVASWTLVMLLLQGASIIAAILLSRCLAYKKQGACDNNKAVEIGRVTHIFFGTFVGYLPGLLIILSYTITMKKDMDPTGIIDTAMRIAPWPLIPAATSGFIVYYLTSLDRQANRWLEAVIQAMTMAFVGAFASLLYSSRMGQELNHRFLIYVTILCLLTGGAIGAIFPTPYRKRKQNSRSTIERRTDTRFSLTNDATLTVAGRGYQCQTLDLSLNGAKVNFTTPLEKGSRVTLKLPDLGVFTAIVKHQNQSSTSMIFEALGERSLQRLQQYLGMSPLQHS